MNLLVLLGALAFLYLLIALGISLVLLEPFWQDSELAPEKERLSWSDVLSTAILWPITALLCLKIFPKTPEEDDLMTSQLPTERTPGPDFSRHLEKAPSDQGFPIPDNIEKISKLAEPIE